MKTTVLILLSFFILTGLHAQKIEISLQSNSGLYHYSGSGATSVTATQSSYTTDPYGSKNAFSYGGGIQAQYTAKTGFITGLQMGYDVLRSKVPAPDPNNIPFYLFTTNTPNPNSQLPIYGQTFFQSQSININPYIGYRLLYKTIRVDLLPGIDLGFNMNTYDKGKATDTANGTVTQTSFKDTTLPIDVRLRFGLVASYKYFGITTSYVHGITNLDKNVNGDGTSEVHSELFRFGITYRIL